MKKTEVLIDPPRKRRFSEEFKDDLLKQIESGKDTVASAARRHEISQSLIYIWKRKAKSPSGFLKVFNTPAEPSSYIQKLSEPSLRIVTPNGFIVELFKDAGLEDFSSMVRLLGAHLLSNAKARVGDGGFSNRTLCFEFRESTGRRLQFLQQAPNDWFEQINLKNSLQVFWKKFEDLSASQGYSYKPCYERVRIDKLMKSQKPIHKLRREINWV